MRETAAPDASFIDNILAPPPLPIGTRGPRTVEDIASGMKRDRELAWMAERGWGQDSARRGRTRAR